MYCKSKMSSKYSQLQEYIFDICDSQSQLDVKILGSIAVSLWVMFLWHIRETEMFCLGNTHLLITSRWTENFDYQNDFIEDWIVLFDIY